MNNLIKVLTGAKKAIKKNHPLIITENFYSDGKTVTATNLDVFFKVYHDARFKGAINPDQFIKVLDIEPTEIEQENGKITFRNGGKKVSLVLEMGDFPAGPELKENIVLNDIKTEPFFKSLNFLSKDELRPAMMHYYFGNKHSPTIEVCATDAHILFLHDTGKREHEEFNTLISKKTIEILKSLKVDQFDLVISRTHDKGDKLIENLIINFFAFGYLCEIVQNVPIVKYPQYKDVIPNDNKLKATYHKKELLSSLKNCEKFGNKQSNKFTFFENKIGSIDLDIETQYSEELTVNGYDEQMRSFNIRCMNEILIAYDSDLVTLQFNEKNTKPNIIEDGNDLFLIMPVL